MSHTDPIIWSIGHLVIWSISGHLVIWSIRHLVIWSMLGAPGEDDAIIRNSIAN
jgi:hypothetical protein